MSSEDKGWEAEGGGTGQVGAAAWGLLEGKAGRGEPGERRSVVPCDPEQSKALKMTYLNIHIFSVQQENSLREKSRLFLPRKQEIVGDNPCSHWVPTRM